MKKVLILISIIIFILIIGFFIFENPFNNSSTLKILVTPTSSLIKLNNSTSSIGIHHLRPGNYTITVSHPGFKTQSKSFSIKKNNTKFIGIILQPNTAKTANFYQTNNYQEQMVEAISSNNNLTGAISSVSSEPIIKYLPYIGPNLQYKINYSVDPKNSKTPYITITANNPQGRQDALSFIKSKGIDPTYLNIVFINKQPSVF